MPVAAKVKNIVHHCTAGFGNVESIVRFWRDTLGWKNLFGYLTITEVDGTIWWLNKEGKYVKDESQADFSKITNGVLNHNSTTMSNGYIGGVENLGTPKEPMWKAKDTRTIHQISSNHYIVQKQIQWLKDNGKDITKDLGYVGHRDFSPDKNGNGVIESWERIKECPSYDVIGSTDHFFYSSADRYKKLP